MIFGYIGTNPWEGIREIGNKLTNTIKEEHHRETSGEFVRDHHTYQRTTKKELEETLSSSQEKYSVSTQQHKDVKQEIKEINLRLSELRYQKIGLLQKQKHAMKKVSNLDDIHETQKIKLQLNEITVEQEALRVCRDNLDKQRTDLWHKTIPQTKRDLAIALETLKPHVSYISEEEAIKHMSPLESLTSEEAKYKPKISLKQLQTVNQLLSYDNTFVYCETSLQPGVDDHLYVMMDTSKTNTPGSLMKYVGENNHAFKVLSKIPVRNITSHYGAPSVDTMKDSILEFYKLYNSANNQFFIQKYAKAFETNPNYSFKKAIGKSLSHAKLEHYIETGNSPITKPIGKKIAVQDAIYATGPDQIREALSHKNMDFLGMESDSSTNIVPTPIQKNMMFLDTYHIRNTSMPTPENIDRLAHNLAKVSLAHAN